MEYVEFVNNLQGNGKYTTELTEDEQVKILKEHRTIRGSDEIAIIAIEEMSELAQRLTKNIRQDTSNSYIKRRYNRLKILEKLTDVKIALLQVSADQQFTNEELKNAFNIKVNRINEKNKELIKEENYNYED